MDRWITKTLMLGLLGSTFAAAAPSAPVRHLGR
jgi:hypothetical protein